MSESSSDSPDNTTYPKEELITLYDIRIKEKHHYNTVVWAFPTAYAGLLTAELHYLKPSVLLAFASLYNVALCYVFCCHLQNKRSITKVLQYTEMQIKKHYGCDLVPVFIEPDFKATLITKLAVIIATFFWFGLSLESAPPNADGSSDCNFT